jgi:hypothetical protein
MIIIEAAKRSKLTIFVDENLYQLVEPLKLLGYKALQVPKQMPDEMIMQFLEGTCLLTSNTKDFESSAVIYDFDLIDMSSVKYIDSNNDRSNTTANLISNAIRESGLSHKKGNWLLKISNEGKHVMKELQ